jgi:hypothetical protein
VLNISLTKQEPNLSPGYTQAFFGLLLSIAGCAREAHNSLSENAPASTASSPAPTIMAPPPRQPHGATTWTPGRYGGEQFFTQQSVYRFENWTARDIGCELLSSQQFDELPEQLQHELFMRPIRLRVTLINSGTTPGYPPEVMLVSDGKRYYPDAQEGTYWPFAFLNPDAACSATLYFKTMQIDHADAIALVIDGQAHAIPLVHGLTRQP